MLEAAIFDMDGLLVESESKWRRAQQEACDRLGLPLTEADFDLTTGVRMGEIAEMWFARFKWDGPTPAEVAGQIIDRVIELCAEESPLDGVVDAIDRFAAQGLRLAVCSSSDLRMIEAILATIGIRDRFELVHSAEGDEYGKPHPMPYLKTAALLGVSPANCVALEDSVAGVISAKSASMKVIAVPDPAMKGSAKFGVADVVLQSLTQLDDVAINSLTSGAPLPTLSRPRFHLAFGVNDLAKAREFYTDVLGCSEGRSDARWIDFDLFGHQIVAHLDDQHDVTSVPTSDVDGHQVPANHFGLLLHPSAWKDLVARIQATNVPFLIAPNVRFAGLPGEQHTCFITDPAGNALELKAFVDDRAVFSPNVSQ